MVNEMDAVERFWGKVEKTTGCWEWQSTKNAQGYGRFALTVSKVPPRQKWHSAHRLVWEWENGPIPDGLIVCHTCDNPSCVNPAHLFLGTHKDNADDRDRKGRIRPPRGERNRHARLRASDVMYIRRLAARGSADHDELAKRFGVCRRTIGAVARGDTWRHLPCPKNDNSRKKDRRHAS